MKKLFSLVLILGVAVTTFSQNTVPRYGITTNQDNTGRVLTYRYANPTDATGADSVRLYPRAWQTIVQYTATDSLAFIISNLTQSYVGDKIEFIVLNSSGSGHQVKFVGSNWQFGSGGAAMALTSAKRASITFEFDGVFWVERSRLAQ